VQSYLAGKAHRLHLLVILTYFGAIQKASSHVLHRNVGCDRNSIDYSELQSTVEVLMNYDFDV
jgi:hypothetical protein